MLRIAVQSKGRLFDDTMNLLSEADIKVSASKRTLLVQSSNFPLEVLYLRDDDIPQSVASGVADIGVVGENEFVERGEDADIVSRLGFSKCRLSLAIPKEIDYKGVEWFNGKKIATSYPAILKQFLDKHSIEAEIHVITGSVEISPGIGLADGIFDIVSSGSTLVSNNLREVEVVMQSEALLIGNRQLSEEKRQILDQMLFRFKAVKDAEDKKYVRMNAPKARLEEIINRHCFKQLEEFWREHCSMNFRQNYEQQETYPNDFYNRIRLVVDFITSLNDRDACHFTKKTLPVCGG